MGTCSTSKVKFKSSQIWLCLFLISRSLILSISLFFENNDCWGETFQLVTECFLCMKNTGTYCWCLKHCAWWWSCVRIICSEFEQQSLCTRSFLFALYTLLVSKIDIFHRSWQTVLLTIFLDKGLTSRLFFILIQYIIVMAHSNNKSVCYSEIYHWVLWFMFNFYFYSKFWFIIIVILPPEL